MLTLSVMQPWAWLLVNGHKDIENRDWKPTNPGLKVRGKALIHAGKNIDGGKRGYADFKEGIFDDFGIVMPELEGLKLGGIVGMVHIIGVTTEPKSRWFYGPYGFQIDRARPLPFMPYKGQLGFFNVKYDLSLLNEPGITQ